MHTCRLPVHLLVCGHMEGVDTLTHSHRQQTSLCPVFTSPPGLMQMSMPVLLITALTALSALPATQCICFSLFEQFFFYFMQFRNCVNCPELSLFSSLRAVFSGLSPLWTFVSREMIENRSWQTFKQQRVNSFGAGFTWSLLGLLSFAEQQ